jgi:hypothetical protein
MSTPDRETLHEEAENLRSVAAKLTALHMQIGALNQRDQLEVWFGGHSGNLRRTVSGQAAEIIREALRRDMAGEMAQLIMELDTIVGNLAPTEEADE